MLCKFIDDKLTALKCKKRKTTETTRSQPSSSPRPLSPYPHSQLQFQSPHKYLRPYYTSSPINPPTPILLQYPLSVSHTSPSLFPSSITYEYPPHFYYSHPIPSSTTTTTVPISETVHVSTPTSDSDSAVTLPLIHAEHHNSITPKDLEEYFTERIKKGTSYIPKNYIRDILDEDMELSNEILITIIDDYNKYGNKITDPYYFINIANKILLEYIEVNDFKTDNIYQAYNFIILGSIVSFWIFYKFMIDDNTINISYLQYYLHLNNVILDRATMLNLEIDILQSIDYSVLKFI